MRETTLQVGSERYNFIKNWDVEYYDDGIPYVFSDELSEYTFVPYLNGLKSVTGYEENRDAFEDVRIYLIIKESRKLIKVPCNVRQDTKTIYMTDGNFNKYWRYISKRLGAGRQWSAPEQTLVQQKDMNKNVDLTFVETPYRTARIGSDYMIKYQGHEVDIEIQRLMSKKASAMDDNKIRYVYSKKDNIVHDKTCQQVKKIHYRDFEAAARLPEERELCQYCKREIYIRSMIGDDNKHFSWYVKMFQQGKVSLSIIEELAQVYHARLYMITLDLMQIKCGEDTWKIAVDKQLKYKLYHNNYVMVSEVERYITSDYHEQKNYPQTLYGILRYIERYDWKKHLEAKNTEQQVVEAVHEQPVVEDASGENKQSVWRRILIRFRLFCKR